MSEQIGTIEEELESCRAAFAAFPEATWAWCLHHEKHCEPLTEPAENRITFMLINKSQAEQALRFRNFRPCKNTAAVKTADAAYAAAVKPACDAYGAAVKTADDAYAPFVKTADDAIRKLHNSEWPNNTWNGKSIFE